MFRFSKEQEHKLQLMKTEEEQKVKEFQKNEKHHLEVHILVSIVFLCPDQRAQREPGWLFGGA